MLDSRKSKLILILLKSSKYLVLVGPLFHFFLAALLLPPYTGYLWCSIFESYNKEPAGAIRVCQTTMSFQMILVRLISGTFAAIAFIPSTYAALSISLVEILLGLVSFGEYLASLVRHVGHKNSTRIIGTFRKIQVAVHNFNQLYEYWFFANALAVGDVDLIICGYCTIKLWKDVSVFGVVCFSNLTITGLAAACCILSVGSKVWVNSEKVIEHLKRKPNVGRNRLLRKKLAACGALKIKIGCVNFVDRATAGVFLLFTVEQIGSLTMLN
jgi:hypothetical protein